MAECESGDANNGDENNSRDEQVLKNSIRTSSDNGDGYHGDPSSDTESEPDKCSNGRDVQCPDYRRGTCLRLRCDHQHPHVSYPPAPKWEWCHLQMLNFENHSVHFSRRILSEEDIICRWLLDETIQNDCLPAVTATSVTIRQLDNVTPVQYCAGLTKAIKQKLQADSFVEVVQQFGQKYDLENAESECLLEAAMNDGLPDAHPVVNPYTRPTLLRWVSLFDSFKSCDLQKASLAHLLAKLAEVAAYDIQCHILVGLNEETEKEITVCGRPVSVCSDVEVQTPDGDGIMQIIIFEENKTHDRPPDVTSILPKMACQALAFADVTSFGNRIYRTVYQVFLHVAKSTEHGQLQLCSFLTKCHLSVDRLQKMVQCPMGSSHLPCHIIHSKVDLPTFQDPQFILFLYKAIKSVLLAFKGLELDELRMKCRDRRKVK
ncbi:uncharacterized protein [Ptychodera flava]|uniref:uncharacterized protein n=1 Tax=Ptychodera flava TaxID=63121 RepID=UPI00396A17FF